MKIRATLLHMAESEILEMIPPYIYEDIKRRDKKPLFKAFVVGQEGKSEANWVGVGKIVKTWFADAIGKLSRKIFPRMPLFHNHDETNSQENRTPIGEVAGSRTKTIKGLFSAIIAAYIYPEYRKLPLNIASVEADLNIDSNDIEGDVRAPNVADVDAIALGDERVGRPGFPGATLISELQMFANKFEHNTPKGGDMEITKSEVLEFIRSEKLAPSDLYSNSELTADVFVANYVKEEGKRASVSEFARRKEAEEKLEALKKEHDENVKTIKDENAKLKSENAASKSGDIFTKKYKDRKLTPQQVKFIESKRKKFTPENPDEIDKEIDAFLDDKVTEFKEIAETFGIKDDGTGDLDTTPPGSEPTEDQQKSTEDDDLSPGMI